MKRRLIRHPFSSTHHHDSRKNGRKNDNVDDNVDDLLNCCVIEGDAVFIT